MTKTLLLISLLLTFSCLKSQTQKTIRVSTIIKDRYNQAIIPNAEFKVVSSETLDTTFHSDTTGLIEFELQLNKSCFVIAGLSARDYYQSEPVFRLDTSNFIVNIDTVLYLDPLEVVLHSWLPPDIYFKKNDSELDSYQLREDSVGVEPYLQQWTLNFKERLKQLDCGVQIESFADYHETYAISESRLNKVFSILKDNGIDTSRLHLVNSYHKDRKFSPYREGSYPYYLLDQEPVSITRNDSKNDSLMSLRRVVSFSYCNLNDTKDSLISSEKVTKYDTIQIELSRYNNIGLGETTEKQLKSILGKPYSKENRWTHVNFKIGVARMAYFQEQHFKRKDAFILLKAKNDSDDYVVRRVQYGPKSKLILNNSMELGKIDSLALINAFGPPLSYNKELKVYRYVSNKGTLHFFEDSDGKISFLVIASRKYGVRLQRFQK